METISNTPLLTTINAPYKTHVDVVQLAESLAGVEPAQAALGQVFSFFTELPKTTQAEFAKTHGVSSKSLTELATYLSAQTGQDIESAL